MGNDNHPATEWSLYVLRTHDGSLYTGISTDVSRRIEEHENKDGKNKGAKALRGKTPLTLVYEIVVGNRSEALKLEYKIKQLSKTLKEELISLKINLVGLKAWLPSDSIQKE